MKIVSFETANSYIKVFDQTKEDVLIYPNTHRHAPKEVIGDTKIKVYRVNDENYLAGITRGFSTSSGKGSDRYYKDAFYVETLIALSHVVEDGDRVIATTGLPGNHYTTKIIQDLQDRFEKQHTIMVAGEEKTFTITELDVYLQPLGTFFFSIVDNRGNKRAVYDELMQGDVLIVDIGFGSTDLAEISQGQLVDYKEVGYAMIDAYGGLMDAMKARYAGTRLETATIHPLQLETETRGKDSFSFGNETYPIAALREKTWRLAANRIMDAVTNLKQLDRYDRVIFTGGGTVALGDHLTKAFNVPNAVAVNNAQEANVRGFNVFSQFTRN